MFRFVIVWMYGKIHPRSWSRQALTQPHKNVLNRWKFRREGIWESYPALDIFWISSKCFTSSHNYENFANLKRTIWKHVIEHGQGKRPFLKDLIPCLHFSEIFKNLENLGGVKLKHLLEIQKTGVTRDQTGTRRWLVTARRSKKCDSDSNIKPHKP